MRFSEIFFVSLGVVPALGLKDALLRGAATVTVSDRGAVSSGPSDVLGAMTGHVAAEHHDEHHAVDDHDLSEEGKKLKEEISEDIEAQLHGVKEEIVSTIVPEMEKENDKEMRAEELHHEEEEMDRRFPHHLHGDHDHHHHHDDHRHHDDHHHHRHHEAPEVEVNLAHSHDMRAVERKIDLLWREIKELKERMRHHDEEEAEHEHGGPHLEEHMHGGPHLEEHEHEDEHEEADREHEEEDREHEEEEHEHEEELKHEDEMHHHEEMAHAGPAPVDLHHDHAPHVPR